MQHTIYVTIQVKISSDLDSLREAIEEFEQETDYRFSGTENVQVVDTEYYHTDLNFIQRINLLR